MEFKFDLHIHTIYSDSIITPKQAIERAKELGLAGIAITDHDNMNAYPEIKKLAKNSGLIIIHGVEITTLIGDILTLGIDKMPKSAKKDLNSLPNIFDVFEEIHEMDGIAAAAHPYGGQWPISFVELMEKLKDKFDAIEIYNGFTNMKANMKAMTLAKKFNLPGIAGSDAHFLEQLGNAYTISRDEDIIEAIKSGNIKVGWE